MREFRINIVDTSLLFFRDRSYSIHIYDVRYLFATTILNTKNVLILVVLSTGLLTVITGTGTSQVPPVFADEDECEDNGDNNCNKQTEKIELENNCKIVNENENDDRSDENSNGGNDNGDILCWNFVGGNEDEVSNEPGDILLCHRPTGNPTQEQELSLSQEAVDSHLANHPFDTLGACST
jgi:hypothetical protein